MRLTIDLPDQIGSKLEQEAERRGVGPDLCAAAMIQETISATERARGLRALFEKWDREDATDDPNELARPTAEWEEFKRAMNSNRSSGRKLFPNGTE